MQTTERYLRCKQNLGHPVKDLFHLEVIATAYSIIGSAVIERGDKIVYKHGVDSDQEGADPERAPEMLEMGTLRCDGCGEEFTVFLDPALANKETAAHQAHWLERFWLLTTSKNANIRIESSVTG